jgi:hypothetical protein
MAAQSKTAFRRVESFYDLACVMLPDSLLALGAGHTYGSQRLSILNRQSTGSTPIHG